MSSDISVRLIRSFEGFSAVPYLCAAGYPTIGFGHVILKRESFPDPISEDDAEYILEKDLSITGAAVTRLITYPLNDNQLTALISWTFNLGAGALQRSTLRMVINRGDYENAPAQIRKWVYAAGRKLRGLVIRREVEAQLFSGGK